MALAVRATIHFHILYFPFGANVFSIDAAAAAVSVARFSILKMRRSCVICGYRHLTCFPAAWVEIDGTDIQLEIGCRLWQKQESNPLKSGRWLLGYDRQWVVCLPRPLTPISGQTNLDSHFGIFLWFFRFFSISDKSVTSNSGCCFCSHCVVISLFAPSYIN